MPTSSAVSSPSSLASSGRTHSSRRSPPRLLLCTSRQRLPSGVPRRDSIRSAASPSGRVKRVESRVSSAISTRLPLMGSCRALPVSRRAVNSVHRPNRRSSQRSVGLCRSSSSRRRQKQSRAPRLTAPSSRERKHQPSPLNLAQSRTLPPKAADRARKQPQERSRRRSPPKAAVAISPDTDSAAKGEASQRRGGRSVRKA